MRKYTALIFFSVLLSSCGPAVVYTSGSHTNAGYKGSLYYWGGNSYRTSVYEDLSYNTYKKQTPEVLCKLVCAYEDMVSHPGGARNVPPPGICAEYAYLLLQDSTAPTFASNATETQKKMFEGTDYVELFRNKAEQLLAKEIEYYPESEVFIVPLVKKFQKKQP